MTPEQAAPGLRDARVPGRLEPVDRGQDFLALVDYAHKPGALRGRARDPARGARTAGRIAVVFGAGGDRDPGKRAPMGADGRRARRPGGGHRRQPARRGSRRDQGGDPGRRRRARRRRWSRSATARAAIAHAVGWAHTGDVVLIAGKGHESGQTAGGQTRAVRRSHRTRGGAQLGARGRDRSDRRRDRRRSSAGELADISAADAARLRITGTVEFDSRAVTPAGSSWRCPVRAPTATTHAAAAVAAGAVAVLAARPVGVPAVVVRPTCPVTAAPACSSTTATARVRPCWRRWRSWPRRWQRAWWRAG